jgi:hypothetical protein
MLCYCADHGVPYERAEDMETWELMAHMIVLGEQNSGMDFDLDKMDWVEKKGS